DPRGHGAWGDYLITMYDIDTLPDLTKVKSVTVSKSFGDDYIAGGPQDDMIFGQSGNDTVQGDGSIDYISHFLMDNGSGQMVPAFLKDANGNPLKDSKGNFIPDPAFSIGGRVGVINVATNYAGKPFRAANNALILLPSFDGAGDGQDYIEGNAGKDILFGNQNQDDLVGGNSDMFSLKDPIFATGQTLRPDDSDLIFGGSGVAIARNAIGDATITSGGDSNGNATSNVIATTANGQAQHSESNVTDNGDIIRLVGVNRTVAPPVGQQNVASFTMNADLTTTPIATRVQSYNGFLRFNYDTGTHDVVGNSSNVAYDDTVKIV